MIRYFCNLCNKEITKPQMIGDRIQFVKGKFSVIVEIPTNHHFCLGCIVDIVNNNGHVNNDPDIVGTVLFIKHPF